jgi:hypothetical protein
VREYIPFGLESASKGSMYVTDNEQYPKYVGTGYSKDCWLVYDESTGKAIACRSYKKDIEIWLRQKWYKRVRSS